MSKLSLFSTIALTLTCVACQSTPPINTKPTVQPLPPVVNQPVQTTQPTLPPAQGQQTYSNNTLVIFYKDAFKASVLSAVEARQAEVIYDYNLMNGIAIRLTSADNVNQAVTDLSKVNGVIAVNRDNIAVLH